MMLGEWFSEEFREMFKKNKCKNCGERVKESFDFCPSCGKAIGNSDDWGMLGKNDSMDPLEELSKNMFGGIGGKMFNKMLGSAMKMLEKELQKNSQRDVSHTKFELYINGKKIKPENIKLTKKPVYKKKEKMKDPSFSSDSMKKFSQLPKLEPKTSIRRLADKVVYEIEIPGVISIEDISVARLENSIEIKAVGDENAYSKLIPINLPIRKYTLSEGKLVLELAED